MSSFGYYALKKVRKKKIDKKIEKKKKKKVRRISDINRKTVPLLEPNTDMWK